MGRNISLFAAVCAAAVSVTVLAGSAAVRAADMDANVRAGAIVAGHQLALNCDNGRIYPIRVRAVSDAGKLVTGYIYMSPRRPHHFRLVPMGTGYRYAAHGFWFDGLRGEATLYIDSREAACTVVYS